MSGIGPGTNDTTSDTTRRAPIWAVGVLCVGLASFAMLFVSAVANSDTQLLQALTVAPLLVAVTIPIALRIARADGDPTLFSIVMAGFVAKLLAAWVRYEVAYKLYSGRTDAIQYDTAARLLVPHYRSFIFTYPFGGSLIGTGFVKVLTGIDYALFGTSVVGGFMVFAWVGFLGILLLTRAFKLGIPQGNTRRYTIAVLFFPGIVYWPSAIGKEAWIMLGLGLASYGVAGIFRHRSDGVLWLALGGFAAFLVRPHIAVLVLVGLVFALLVREAPARSYAAPFFRVLGLALLVVLGVFVAGRTASYLKSDTGLTVTSVSASLTKAQSQTADGGSQFSPVTVGNNPLKMIPAAITIFFRPFPIEAHSGQELATAVEGILLFALLAASAKRLRSFPRMFRKTPYLAYCVGYLVPFVYAFSSFANFGILARQRVQAVPFLLVLIALPKFSDLVSEDVPPVAPALRAVPDPTPAPTPGGRRRSRRPRAEADATAVTTTAVASTAAGSAPAAEPGSAWWESPRGARPRTAISTGSSFPPPPRLPS